jgi:HJR/Mrr/RecB family endonuclease
MIKDFFLAMGGIYLLLFAMMLALVLFAHIRHKLKNKASKTYKSQDQKVDIVKDETIEKSIVESEESNLKSKKEERRYEPGEYISEKYLELQINIKGFIENSNNFPLLVAGSMIGLDARVIIGENSKFDNKFIEVSKELINYQKFKIITNGRITNGEYEFSDTNSIDLYHQIVSSVYVEKFNNFFVLFKDYFDFIEQNKELLVSKKRLYLKEDEFGDIDASDWIDYLQRFAERRNLYKESQYPDELEVVSNYIKIIGLHNFEGKAISYLLALWEHFEKKDNKYASIYTGVDFELYLKTLIEEQLEGAYVETTPASGDHGADLLVRFRGIVVAVQAKYYTGSVGNAAVQEIHSGMGFYDADYGMVVTQSKYTEHAKSLAMKLNIHLEDVETFIPKIKSLSD